MAIRGLIFDKDGTLFAFEATWASWAKAVLTDLFGARAEATGARLGFDLGAMRFLPGSPVIAETTDHLAGLLVPDLPGWDRPRLIGFMKERARATALVEAVPLVPLFEGLRARGLKLGLATNDDESSARAHLERAGIAHWFDFVAGYDSGFGGKPETGQMRAFLAATGLAAAEVAMIGDSLHDLDAGAAAGMRVVGVLSGPATAAALAPHADVVLPDIGHLPGWLDSLAAPGGQRPASEKKSPLG